MTEPALEWTGDFRKDWDAWARAFSVLYGLRRCAGTPDLDDLPESLERAWRDYIAMDAGQREVLERLLEDGWGGTLEDLVIVAQTV